MAPAIDSAGFHHTAHHPGFCGRTKDNPSPPFFLKKICKHMAKRKKGKEIQAWPSGFDHGRDSGNF